MATIVHFDINADDPALLGSFYGKLLDWKITAVPGMNYYFIETAGLNGGKGIGGGISQRSAETWKGITSFIGVASIDATISRVTELGGKVLLPRQRIPGYGYNAICADPENNVFGLFEEDAGAA